MTKEAANERGLGYRENEKGGELWGEKGKGLLEDEMYGGKKWS